MKVFQHGITRTHLVAAAAVIGAVMVHLVTGYAAPPATPDATEQRNFLELSRKEHNAKIIWEPQTSITFDDPAVLKDMRMIEGQWEVREGRLEAVSGKTDRNRTLLIAPCLAEQMRIEFDAILFPRADGRIGDIALRLNADPTTGSFARGYALITAQYWNQATVCYKLNIPIARTEWSPIIPGQTHHVVAEWTNMHLRLFVDDRIVLDAWDRDTPQKPDPERWIGIATYDTHMVVDNLVISTVKK